MVRKHDPRAAHLRVRLDSKLLRRLEQAAERNQQSMNAEIIARLDQSFSMPDTAEAVRNEVERFYQRIEHRIRALVEHDLRRHEDDVRSLERKLRKEED